MPDEQLNQLTHHDTNSTKRLTKPSKEQLKEEQPWLVPFPLEHPKKNQNYIRTAKYTILTFIPLQFFYQFSKSYNLYFLLSALTVFYGASSLSPVTQILPLVIVFTFSAGKEAIEDYSRSTSDKKANKEQYSVIRNGIIEKIDSRHITKGDIFYIEKGEKVPVDAILLSSSYEDGTCFIETADLDGETNLKRRNAPTETCKYNTPSRIQRLKGKVECEQPNVNLNVFNGRLIFEISDKPQSSSQQPIPVRNSIVYPSTDSSISLNMDHILLRGTVLQNTDYVYGLVIFTGLNTKIMRNLKKSKQKTSTLESRLKKFTIAAFAFNFLMLASSVILEYVQYQSLSNTENTRKALLPQPISPFDFSYYAQWYLGPQDPTTSKHVTGVVFSFFALYTYIIPISLFVTIEIARLFQGRFMMWDRKMRIYKKLPNGKTHKMKMKANNTNLNEELGNVEYIFSDKTGTLTQNDMRASKWLIKGVIFDEMDQAGSCFEYLKEHGFEDPVSQDILLFTQCLTLCHSVIPALDEEQKLIYESQSPDESALLNAMSNTKSILQSRNKTHITVDTSLVPGFKSTIQKYEHLASIEFNSDRKRMSVVVKDEQGQIFLFCKGADNIIMERLDKSTTKESLEIVNIALTEFSVEGLRTLCVAYKKLTNEAWTDFKRELDEAENALVNREELVAAVGEKWETGFVLIGCTAIEDRLQDDVPETISFLLKMGIKLWLLTGDKMETAINIGMSSKLITKEMKLVTMKSKTEAECSHDIDDALKLLEAGDPSQINALVINGEALAFALTKPLGAKFLSLGVLCHSVICCRVTPLQKALVVKLAKDNLKCITLAIGDGANDVSMIQAADIGIGIQGREGAQAVRAADYSFAEFRFLARLLSVHGRYSYHRLCQLIFISFYKNVTMITVQWWFGLVSEWSGQIVYEEIFLTAFNVVFTSIPPFVLSIFDKDVNEFELEQYPQLYQEVRRGLYWNRWIIGGWIASAMWHNTVTFGTVYLLNAYGQVDVSGHAVGYWIQCYLFATPLLFTIMLKTALVTRYWTWFMFAAIMLSLLVYIIAMFILPSLGYTPLGTATDTYQVSEYFFLVIMNPILCCLPDFTIIAPSDADIMIEEGTILKKRGRICATNVDIPLDEMIETPPYSANDSN